jgi:hypothetical protein
MVGLITQEGVIRWHNRVIAYVFVPATDQYPPFRLAPSSIKRGACHGKATRVSAARRFSYEASRAEGRWRALARW